jgi:hypothetical protein
MMSMEFEIQTLSIAMAAWVSSSLVDALGGSWGFLSLAQLSSGPM